MSGRRRGKGDLLLGCDFQFQKRRGPRALVRRVPGAPVGVDVVAEPDARPDTALPLLVRHGDVHFPATVLKVCDGEQQRSNLEVTYLQPTKNTAVCETPPRTSRRG